MNRRDRSLRVFYPLCLFLVLIALPLSSCADRGENPATPTPTDRASSQNGDNAKTRRIPAIVETVEANVIESESPQLSLAVTGNFQDGCEAPLKVERKQEDDRINITLYRELAADLVCPAVLVPFEEVIPLEGEFARGTHTLEVNGIEIEAKI
ncbi:MAG: hypothetical protein AAGA60_15205 [Cyanobacteria bacterium P01_E01_bin.42]